ncbi:hypothetical protein [Lysinibacillus sp. RC79]|uniref:hypothetical protein n=1 Tax=Lysinibacillus sp. RC79 TaxID=3156296 RepID=UPI003517330F
MRDFWTCRYAFDTKTFVADTSLSLPKTIVADTSLSLPKTFVADASLSLQKTFAFKKLKILILHYYRDVQYNKVMYI